MHNIFANAGDINFDFDGWISFWQNVYELERDWPENNGDLIARFLSLGKSLNYNLL